MRSSQVLLELKSKISIDINLETAIRIFINHYKSTEVDNCSKLDEGDILLYQWGGPYPWDNSFSINLTRQFSFNDINGNYIWMKQLGMDIKYLSSGINIESGNFWLEDNNLNDFLMKIFNSEVFLKVKDLNMNEIAFELSDV